MNKIYKVVWNKARNCYVVASEFAKNHSTSSVTKKKVSIAAILAAGMLSGFSPMVSGAANTTDGSSGIVIYGDNNTVSSSNSVTLGNEISSLGGANVAIGYGSKAGNQDNPKGPNDANGATAVGTGSQATNYRATALGDFTVASGTDSLGLGTTAQATGDRSISAGLSSEASGVNAIAIGDKTVSNNSNTVAIGEMASATNSQSIAIGSYSSSSGSYSVAIGLHAKATNDWSVALGNSSETAAAVPTYTMAVGGKIYKTAGGSAMGTISVGNENVKRTVTNVAAGRVSETSTDAINGSQLYAVQQEAVKHTKVVNGSNITVEENDQDGQKTYKVGLNKDLKLDSVKIGENVSLTKDGLTAGDTKVTNAGLSIGDKTYVTKDGLYANGNKVTQVAAGKVEKDSTDAVNGGQLYETNQAIANNATNISSLSHSISNLDNRVNKVGAGAAALAALHPLDFDPDAKWDFAAGYGNYRGTNAAAVGAYYRPNEDTMFSVGGTFGNGENMVNAGVSFKLGAGSSHVSTSRVAMAKEIKELRAHMAAQDKLIAQLTGPVNALTGSHIQADLNTLFPDVPKNHWAYDYVTKLAQAGYIEGYPDGNFKGDAMMTRYEFAAVIYRAMMNGAARDAKLGGDENLNKLLKEFEPELEYIRIDTIAKDKAGNPTIQRVRTVKANTNK